MNDFTHTARDEVRILVVDDDAVDRLTIREELDHVGYEAAIEEAGTLEVAVHHLTADDFDCVLLDYNLPDGTGHDFLEWIQEHGIEVPVIVLTGQTDEEIAARLMSAGAYGYLPKRKLNGAELRDRLVSVIGSHESRTALERTRERLEIAVVSSGIGIWEYDPRTGNAQCDVAGCHLMGLSPDVETPLPDFLARVKQDHRAKVSTLILNAAEDIDAKRTGTEFLTELDPEGVVRWIELSAQPAVRGQGDTRRVARVVGTIADVTSQRREANRLRFLAQAGAALANGFDPADTLHRLAELVAPAWADLCVIATPGGGPDEVWVGSARGPGIDAEVADRIEAWVTGEGRSIFTVPGEDERIGSHLIVAGTRESLETRLGQGASATLLTDADIASMVTVAVPGPDQTNGGILLISTHPELRYAGGDLLVLEELARRLATKLESVRVYTGVDQARATAESALKDRDYLLQVISHDLRDPIGTILGAASLLQMDILSEDQIKVQAGVIQRVGSRMSELVEGLLDVSRMEAGQFRVDLKPVELDDLIAESATQLQPAVTKAGGTLSVELPAGLPNILGDRPRLLQVIANLVGNALKHAGDEPIVVIRANARAQEVQISVQDSGPGIAPEKTSRLFERFWQDEGTVGGAGLGLAIVKGIVEAHSGRIWVESTPAIGSVFTFGLPIVSEDRSPAEAEAGTPA